jgi:class 3 adenylate cyclase
LNIRNSAGHQRKAIGRKILLEPVIHNGQNIFLGEYREALSEGVESTTEKSEAILITETVEAGGRIICREGEIYKAPYFILDVTFDKLSIFDRISEVFQLRKDIEYSHDGLIETVNRLRENSEEKARAYKQLETANRKLESANCRLEEYSKNLEIKVEERTTELAALNRNLQETVDAKVEEIKRYNELRRYLSPHFADRLLGSGGSLGSEPQRKVMSVLFSDIRNFSYFTDNLEPEETVHLLHRYLSEMTALIHKYEGTLNKIMGDGLMVFFGDPIPMDDHAERAVRLATEMQKKVRELKAEWSHYGHELGIGIGINTGYMTVGSIGSQMHKDYTVIGNQVNVASRLESKAGVGQILISQRTYSKVKDLFSVEIIGTIEVKGIHHPVAIYNVSAD